MNALDIAISLMKGPSNLARALGVERNVVCNWRSRGVPVEQCPFVEAAVGDPRVTCEQLRPDYKGWELIRQLPATE